jgi:hypothetical protein
MPLSLPGVLGRIFSSATALFQSSQVAGESFPSNVQFGNGNLYISDGSEDLTNPALVYNLPTLYVRTRLGKLGFVLRGESGTTIRNVFELQDYLGNTIFAIQNAGGIYHNDNFKITYGILGPNGLFADIYGHLQLGSNSAIRCSLGPPGNIMRFDDATGELFQRQRNAQQGSWTATNAAWSGHSFYGTDPAGLQFVRTWTAAAAGNIVATTGTGLSGYPVTPGVFYAAMLLTRAATAARSKTLGLLFYDKTGTVIGSATAGTARTDTTTGWTRLDVQAVAPSNAAYCALQQTITGAAGAGEAHYDTCAGIWANLVTSQVTAWNAPFVFRTDTYPPAASAVSACTGNGVSPIVLTIPAGHQFHAGDLVTVSGVGGNTAANQAGVALTAVTATTVTIAGTGNGAYTTGGAVQLNFSVTGAGDGASVGDVFIRADGPSNVVQRFWTCAVAGAPWQQLWVSDPRITANPARLNWYGGSYLQQGVPSDPDYVLPSVSMGMLHNDPPDSVNRGVVSVPPAWNLLSDTSSAQLAGGHAMFTQSVRKKTTGAPYVSKDGMFCFMYGLWDLAAVTSGQGSGVMTQLNATSTGAIVQTLRDMITHARAASILPYTNAAFTLSGGANSGTVAYAYSGGAAGAGGTFRNYTATSGTFTFTIPADFAGTAVSISLLGAVGAFGGVVTWTGTLFTTGGIPNPGTTNTTNLTPASSGSRGRVCTRFKGLSSANAGQTIIGTITSLDSGGTGSVGLDCAYIEGPYPNMVAVLGMPRLPAAAGYSALAGTGSYWNGNSGSTGDGDVTQLNTALQALVAEFDANVFYVDCDSAVQKQAAFFASDGFTLGAFGVHAIASQFITALQAQLPLVNFRNVNHDYHDTSVVPVGGPFTKQGVLTVTTGVSRFYADDYYYITAARASVNTAPTGAAIIVDILKNGVTIFTTSANRPTIAISGFTGVSSAPDIPFVVPGDYLTVNIAQVGSTVAGADLVVSVLGRKVPIP